MPRIFRPLSPLWSASRWTSLRSALVWATGIVLILLWALPEFVWSLQDEPPAVPNENSEAIEGLRTNVNYIWVLVSAALVFLMQAGFMCLESGMSTTKNSINVAIKNMADMLLAVVAFITVGFGIMFGMSYNGWFGTTDFFLNLNADPWLACFFVFQAVFCGTAATIDSGVIAGRAKFSTYLLISFIISAIIYPVSGHWAWGSLFHSESGGWLEAKGFIDFAGSTVVHSVGGWVGLAAAIVVGPRIGKFNADGTPRKIPAGDMQLAYLGTFILFFGWFGFNCGSTLEATSDIAAIAVNTMVAACFGGITSSILSWMLHEKRRPQADMIINGVLAGLVGITAGCAVVNTYGAIAIGVGAGVVVYFGCHFIERVLKIDDVVMAIPVHGFCGAYGTVALAIFMPSANLPEGMTRLDLIGVQCLGVGATFIWAFGAAFLLLKLAAATMGVRVSEEDEITGLNVAEHGAEDTMVSMARAMQRAIETGRYDESLKIEGEPNTEIGEIADGFNRLIDALIEERAAAAASLERFRAYMDESVAAITVEVDRIGETIESSTTHAQSVSAEISSVNDLIETLARDMAEIDQRARTAEEHVRQATDTSEVGKSEVMQLSEAAQAIESVVTTIRSIASETNMLALNATIEAARAGEAGACFTVVANEVKELAGQSAESTAGIDQQIGAIQARTQLVAQSMDQIRQMMDETKHLHEAITETIVQQTQQAQQATAAVHTVNGLSHELIERIQAVYECARGISARVEETHTHFLEHFVGNQQTASEVL